MKVYGELEQAVLQQIAGTTTTPAVPGRIYADITTTTAVVPMFYNGSAWRPVTLGQTSALISQNSGKGVLINWATGLNQQVILTNNTVIEFENPVSGAVHTLVVTQGASSGLSPGYSFKFDVTDQDSRRGWYQPQTQLQPGESVVYSWFYSAGIKTAYATIPNMTFAPITAPGSAVLWGAMAPSGKNILIANSTSPFTFGYQISDSAIKPSFGAKALVTSATAAAACVSCAYSPDGNAIFTLGGTTPYIQGWFVDRDTPVGSAWTNPTNLPAGAGQCLAVHPNGGFVGVGHATTPFIRIYPYSGAGFGVSGDLTNLTSPSPLPAAAVTAIAWAPQGDYLTVCSATSPFIQTYAFTSTPTAGAVGAVASNPSSLPAGGPATGSGKQVAWRPQGDYIAMTTGNNTPYVYVVPFNRTTGVYGTPLSITALSGQAFCVAWTPDGQYLLVGTGTAPFLYCFDFSSGTIGSTITLDGSALTLRINDLLVSPGGDWAIMCQNASTYLNGIGLPNKTKNYLRLNV